MSTKIPEGYVIDRSKINIHQIMPPTDYLIDLSNGVGLPDWRMNPKYLKKITLDTTASTEQAKPTDIDVEILRDAASILRANKNPVSEIAMGGFCYKEFKRDVEKKAVFTTTSGDQIGGFAKLGGIPIIIDNSMKPNEFELRDQDGKVLSKGTV